MGWLFSPVIALVLLGPADVDRQGKKTKPTLGEDWKGLLRYRWVNNDPKDAWEELDKDTKSFLEDVAGIKGGWSRISISFYRGRGGDDWMDVTYHYDPKRWFSSRAFTVLKSQEDKDGRYLLLGRDGRKLAKIKYSLKDGTLKLLGSIKNGSVPNVVTGDYRGLDDAVWHQREKLQGTWVMVSGEVEGKKLSEEKVKKSPKVVLIFAKESVSLKKYASGEDAEPQVLFKGTFNLDPSQKPKTLDITITEDFKQNLNKGKTVPGIYELEGDLLKWCAPEPGSKGERPKEFSMKPGAKYVLSILKREKR